jgi:hypothetical protein
MKPLLATGFLVLAIGCGDSAPETSVMADGGGDTVRDTGSSLMAQRDSANGDAEPSVDFDGGPDSGSGSGSDSSNSDSDSSNSDAGCLQILVNYDRSVNLIPCGTGSGCLIGSVLYGQPVVLDVHDAVLCIVPYVPCNDNLDGSEQSCRGITVP